MSPNLATLHAHRNPLHVSLLTLVFDVYTSPSFSLCNSEFINNLLPSFLSPSIIPKTLYQKSVKFFLPSKQETTSHKHINNLQQYGTKYEYLELLVTRNTMNFPSLLH